MFNSDLLKPNEIKMIKPEGVQGLIQKFCYVIGNIPSSYKLGITIEEQILAIGEYLETKVYPALNNNAEALAELQTLFSQLKDYVTNYFDNLDVQEEIENKIDKMVLDGTFYRLINEDLFSNINNNVLTNSQNIANLQEQTNNMITNQSANAITMNMLSQEVREAMTGGSTAIVDENSINTKNIIDEAVTIFKLDKNLQNLYNIEYQGIDVNYSNVGYAKINTSTNKMSIDETSVYRYGTVNLEKNNIYDFSGVNYYAVFGIVVVDPSNDNEVVFSTYEPAGSQTTEHGVHTMFKCNRNGLVAYLNTGADTYQNYTLFGKKGNTLTKISNITINIQNNSINKVKEIDNYIIPIDTNSVGNLVKLQADNNNVAKLFFYKMNIGTKYKIKSTNIWSIAGIILTDNNFNITYMSSTDNTTPHTDIEYEFVASNNGFIILTEYIWNANLDVRPVIEIVSQTNNPYINKKWTAMGDSITDFITLGNNVDNYVNYVSDKLGIDFSNKGNSGSGYLALASQNKAFYQVAQNIDVDTNVITIFGSFNDLSQTGFNIGNVDDTGTNSLCGCINTAIDNLMSRCPNAVIGIIIPIKWHNDVGDSTPHLNYVEALKNVCKRRSIPYLDLYNNSNMHPENSDFKQMFYKNADAVHPNTLGHKRFAPMITEFIKSLL